MGNDLIYKINSEVCPPDKFDHRVDVVADSGELSDRLEEIMTFLKTINSGELAEEVICYIKQQDDGKYNIHTYFPQI